MTKEVPRVEDRVTFDDDETTYRRTIPLMSSLFIDPLVHCFLLDQPLEPVAEVINSGPYGQECNWIHEVGSKERDANVQS